MACTVIVSVGTSLLSNNVKEISPNCEFLLDKFGKSEITVQQMKRLSFEFDEDILKSVSPNDIEGLKDFSGRFFELYLNEPQVRENIAHRAYREKKRTDLLPAEISSLILFYYQARKTDAESVELIPRSSSKEKDAVTLLTTDTADAVFCAKMLREYIGRLPLLSEKCEVEDIKVIENLDIYDPRQYANEDSGAEAIEKGKGLYNLYEYLQGKFAKHQGRKALIRTGGYKEFSADLKLAALSYGFKSLYLFERSLEFVETSLKKWPTGGAYEIWKKSYVPTSKLDC